MPRSNDLGLPDAFIEWIDDIVAENLNLSNDELVTLVHKTTGEEFTVGYIEHLRTLARALERRADRYPEL